MRPLSGRQHALRFGSYEAEIASVGASLRSLRFEGRDIVVPFEADEVRPNYRGATLAPWPNRVTDGSYSFAGRTEQLALTEPGRGHALHGLVAWQEFGCVDESEAHVTLETVVEPQAGYPWRVTVSTRYELTDTGLTQSVALRNESQTQAPVGAGPHPYLVAGPGSVDDWALELPAEQVLDVTEDRLVPTALRSVAGDERFDYVAGGWISAAKIDHAYTALLRGDDGWAVAKVTTQSGSGVALAWDETCAWVQVHTADLPGESSDRIGLAVEPMTCAPDAFNDSRYAYDTGLVALEPGETLRASWRIFGITAT